MKNIENAEQNDQIEQVEPPLQPTLPDPAIDPTSPKVPRNRSKTPARTVVPLQRSLHTSKDFKPFYYRLGAFPKQTYKGIQKWISMGENDEQLSKEVLFTSEKYVMVDRVPKDIAKDYIKKNQVSYIR